MKVVCGLFLVFCPILMWSTTLLVPEQYSTIQSAIDAAQAGDTVLVAEGVYYENIRIENKDLVVTSSFRQQEDPNIILNTVIDGSQYNNPNAASAVFIRGGTAQCVVEGFTVRGGRGSIYTVPGWGNYLEGGGFYITSSSATVRHNVITQNEVRRQGSNFLNSGGAAFHTSSGAPTIEQNIIACNYGGYGSVIITNHTNLTFRNNIVFNNIAEPYEVGTAFGATILVFGGTVTIENNTICGNVSKANSIASSGRGGGVLIWNAAGTIRKNIIWHNHQSLGGQVFLNNAPGVTVSQNNIEDGSWANNLAEDPLLQSGTLALSAESPSINPYDNGEQGAYGGIDEPLFPVVDQAGLYSFDDKKTVTVTNNAPATFQLELLSLGNVDLQIEQVESTGESQVLETSTNVLSYLSANILTLQVAAAGEKDTLELYHSGCHAENPLKIALEFDYVTNTQERPSGVIKVYPNPANDRLTVELAESGDFDLVMTDSLGRVVLEKALNDGSGQMEIDISTLAKGKYELLIYRDGIIWANESLVI